MPEDQTNRPDDGDAFGLACQKALAETSKALKAFSFYPENHPLRRQILDSAYETVLALAATGSVSLIVQRGGFSLAGGRSAIGSNPMTRALAQELFSRELQRLTIFPEISRDDLSGFLTILALPPQKIAEEGGVGELLTRNGIATVVVNQIDVTAVFTKKKAGEAEEETAAEELPETREPEAEQPQGAHVQQPGEPGLDELLAALVAERDEERYAQLARLLLKKALPLKQDGNFDRLYLVLMRLVRQVEDPERSAACRDAARGTLQQLCAHEMTEHLLNHLEDVDFPHKEHLCRILKHAGAEAAEAVAKRLAASGGRAARKALATALVRIGPSAQAKVLPLLKDGKIAVVQAAVAVLGEIGSREAVKGLTVTIHHPDNRVRMESIRSLARIGGMEATAALLSLVHGADEATAVQAITWLGTCRNQGALEPLLRLIARRDLMGKLQALKKEALHAVGRIGDRRALIPLFKLVKKRHLIAPTRHLDLKLAAVEAVAALGGEQARAFLNELSNGEGELARPAQVVLAAMAQKGEEHE